MVPLPLLGPPELYNRTPPTPHPRTTTVTATPNNLSMDLFVADYNNINIFKEKQPTTFPSSDNPCHDFFFHVVPDTLPNYLEERLVPAWSHNPLTTLKLIINLRTSKFDKEGFYTAALWLHKHHPKTLACNLNTLASFGCFKDVPEILYRLLQGLDVRRIQKEEWNQRKFGLKVSRRKRIKKTEEPKEVTRRLREDKKIAMAKKVLDRYSCDHDFRFLHEQVSDLFAGCLRADMEFMKSDQTNKVSLAAKWCPSVNSSFDKSTLLCESIARKMFPRGKYPEYEDIEEAHYAYRVRDRLRKEVLVPLRKVHVGSNKWNAIPAYKLEQPCIKNIKEKLYKYDNYRFYKYIRHEKKWKSRLAPLPLLPNEVIAAIDEPDEADQFAEEEWQCLVSRLQHEGKLKNCMAVCDVSHSMGWKPIEVSVGMGLLISELSDDPWKGKIITFSQDPQFRLVEVEGDNLVEKVESVKSMDWSLNVDFQKVFDLILGVGVQGNLKPEQMVKRLFVFTDMEFDEASFCPWENEYQAIVKKFSERGYMDAIPQIIFWNLRDSVAVPMIETRDGVTLIDGYSKNLIKMCLEENGDLSPENVMRAAISSEEYQKLVVLD